MELGVFYRLVHAAWLSPTPGELADDDAFLAAVARINLEDWLAMKPRLLLALCTTRHCGRILFEAVHRVYHELAAAAAQATAQRREAGKASALARNRPHERPPQRPFNERSTAVERPFNERSNPRYFAENADSARPSRAHAALERSNAFKSLERSSADSSGEGSDPHAPRDRHDALAPAVLAGAIYDGLDAAATARVAQFRKAQATVILAEAFKRWQNRIVYREGPMSGRERTDWDKDIRGIVAYPQVTPATAEIAVLRCDQCNSDPDRGAIGNPIGWIINALGAKRGGTALTPYLSDLAIVEKWATKEKQVFDSEKTKAAASAAARRISAAVDEARGQTNGQTQARQRKELSA